MAYRLLAIVAAVGLIIGVMVISAPRREGAGSPTASGPPHDPGYAARNARLIQTGADGRPLYTLDAAQVEQQPDTGRVDLEQVRLGFRDSTGNQWNARADRGELAQASGVLQLEGGVQVAGVLPDSGQPAEIATEHLDFDTRAQIIATRDPVTLLVSGRELHAQGLSASLKERRVQLESSVHGSFLP
jgi:lipopolysaccharide export system protein LptC